MKYLIFQVNSKSESAISIPLISISVYALIIISGIITDNQWNLPDSDLERMENAITCLSVFHVRINILFFFCFLQSSVIKTCKGLYHTA